VTGPVPISLNVNGERVNAHVLPRLNLADFLREHLSLTGTHVGCEQGVCGACTVRVNGDIVHACLVLAVQTQNASIETIEGLSDSGEIADLQAAFRDRNALQCGFCTPGMLMAAQDLLRQRPEPVREQIREPLSGNYCGVADIRNRTWRHGRGRSRHRRGRRGGGQCGQSCGKAVRGDHHRNSVDAAAHPDGVGTNLNEITEE
jgi:aerobic carbon-monoxide dehydrogenase small subunit